MVKNFFKIQADFFGDVAKSYFAPLGDILAFLGVILAFLGVLVAMGSEMLTALCIKSEDYEVLNELKMADEVDALTQASMVSADEIEAELG